MQDAWRAWQKTLPADQKARAFEDFATVTAVRVTEAGKDASAVDIEQEDTSGGGGGGPSASPLDDLLKKLRDIRKNQIGVTKGFEASANAINKLFGGGAGINLFSGIENDMRRLGAGEDLISLIAGMDPEEFEKKKNTLFNFDKQTGEIIGFKNQLKNIGKALSAIAIGQYVNQQQKQAQESKNQVLAFNQLRSSGYSVAEAYEAIQDAALAAGIVAGDYTQQQIAEMLALQRATAEAAKQFERLTPEGKQQVFDEGFNKAMEAFDVQEKKLTLEYELKIADDQKIIEDAQNQIDGIRYQLDDYEADLRGIEQQEDAINKTYDDKLEALEKVRKANQKVLDQEKGKLSVAEAITRGDLSAAARAIQDVRQTSASGYFSSQTDALNQGRQNALDAIRGENGLSRIEIQERIETLTNQIFEIEENSIEPATERVRLAGVELASRIKELEVLDKTKTEWETIKNNIDFARVNSKTYKDAIIEAEKIVQKVLDAWNEIEKPKSTVYTVTTVREGDVSPGGPGGPGGPGNPGPDPLDPSADTPAAQANRIRQALNNATTAPKVSKALRDAAGVTMSNADRAEALINSYLAKITKAQADAILSKAGVTGRSGGGSNANRFLANGGRVMSYMSDGGSPLGSDTVPAMLTPGEFVVRRPMVRKYGTDLFNKINSGSFSNVQGMSSPNIQNITTPMFNSTGPSVSVDKNSVPSTQVLSPSSNSVYNYNLSVNVASQSDPNSIAQTVMGQIRMIDSQRIRGNRF
jgi:hypothetical protein